MENLKRKEEPVIDQFGSTKEDIIKKYEIDNSDLLKLEETEPGKFSWLYKDGLADSLEPRLDSSGRTYENVIKEYKIGPEEKKDLLYFQGEWMIRNQTLGDWKKSMDSLFDDSNERYK